MRKLLLSLLVMLFAGILTQAQIGYRSYNSVGVVVGESKSAYQVLTTHGIQYHKWYAGAGVGIDDYRNRTVPLVVSLLRDVLPRNNMFININAGPQFVWGKNQRNEVWNAIESKALPGFLGEAGIGYRIKVGNEGQSIMFGSYYSYKTHKEKYIVPGICNNPPCQNATEYITSSFSRWAFKLGLVF